VTIEQRASGQKKWTEVTKLTPAEDGSFSYTLAPESSADYRANIWDGELLSKTVTIGVRPIITLTATRHRVRGGTFMTLRSRVVPGESATAITLTRYDSQRQEWKRVQTRATKTGIVSFRWQVDFGRSSLRASVSKRGLSKGFAEASSRTFLVIGTGKPPTRKRGRHH